VVDFSRFSGILISLIKSRKDLMISSQNIRQSASFCLALAALALAAVLPLKADMVELTNGDHYRGKVVSMDANTIEFLSEIQGKVHLPRNKVAQITFGEAAAKPVARTNAPAATAPSIILSGTNAPAATTASPGAVSAEAVVEQMRQQGVQPQLINQVQEQIFGKASPEASAKFEEIMNGLMSGKISVQDLRGQAQTAIQQARDAKKELGGDAGEMLDGYIAILEKFVAESAPSATPAPAASAPATSTTSTVTTATFSTK
jgi:hypothetical protein